MRHPVVLMREFSIPLLAGLVMAMVWANTSSGTYHDFIHGQYLWGTSFHFITNDIFMAFFFGIAAVEITQSCLPGGDLNPPAKAVNPLLATLGGVLGPIIVYLAVNEVIGAPEFQKGWGIPTATDIAFAWLAGRAVFGERHPAVSFLLLLAIADDAIGLVIIALFYGDPNTPVAPEWLLVTIIGMVFCWYFRRRQVDSYLPYIAVGGFLSWMGLLKAHLHPALALVFIVPFIPHRGKGDHFFVDEHKQRSPLLRFEHDWKPIVDFGLFAFGLANGGVTFSAVGAPTAIVFISVIGGKTIGITSAALLARRMGYQLPDKLGLKDVVVVSMAAAIGLTVAIFVATAAFSDHPTQGAAKMGALLTGMIFPIVILTGKILGVGRFSKKNINVAVR